MCVFKIGGQVFASQKEWSEAVAQPYFKKKAVPAIKPKAQPAKKPNGRDSSARCGIVPTGRGHRRLIRGSAGF